MAVVITRGDMFTLEEKGVAVTIPVNTVGVTSSPHFSEELPASTRGNPLSTGVTSPQSTGRVRFVSPLKRRAFSLLLS